MLNCPDAATQSLESSRQRSRRDAAEIVIEYKLRPELVSESDARQYAWSFWRERLMTEKQLSI